MRIIGSPDWHDTPLPGKARAPVNSYRLYRERIKREPVLVLKAGVAPERLSPKNRERYRARLEGDIERIRRWCASQMKRRSLSDEEKRQRRLICEMRARTYERALARLATLSDVEAIK